MSEFFDFRLSSIERVIGTKYLSVDVVVQLEECSKTSSEFNVVNSFNQGLGHAYQG